MPAVPLQCAPARADSLEHTGTTANGATNAYRPVFDTLHYNTILIGKHSVSVSFMCTLVSNLADAECSAEDSD